MDTNKVVEIMYAKLRHTHSNHVHLNGEEPRGKEYEKGEENEGRWGKKRELHKVEGESG